MPYDKDEQKAATAPTLEQQAARREYALHMATLRAYRAVEGLSGFLQCDCTVGRSEFIIMQKQEDI